MEEFDKLISQFEKIARRPGEMILNQAQITSVEEARKLITIWSQLFRRLLIGNGVDPRRVTRLTTEFRDALEYPRRIRVDSGKEF